MDQPERLVESLVDSSWVVCGTELFADELKDLEHLEEMDEKLASQQQQQQHRSEVVDGCDVLRESYDGSAWSQERRTTSKPRKSPTFSKQKLPDRPSSRASTGGQAKEPSSICSTAASVRVKTEKVVNVAENRGQDLYKQMLQALKQQIRQVREEADLRRSATRRQLRFFSARNVDEYLPSEILRGAPEKHYQWRSEVSGLDYVTEDVWRRTPHQDDAASSPSPSVTDSRSALTILQTPYGSGTSYPAICDFTIDPINFMAEINVALEKNHGVRIVTKESQPPAEEPDPSMLLSNQLCEMLEHQPGPMMDLKEPTWFNTVLPPIASKMEEKWVVDNSEGQMPWSGVGPTKKVKGGGVERLQLAFPPLPARAGQDSRVASGGTATKRAAVGTTTDGCNSSKYTGAGRSAIGDMDKLVRCSATDDTVRLRAKAGTKTTRTVRFTNHCTRHLAMRLQPATHPWLKYSIVKASAGKPLAASSGLCTALDKPVTFFEYIDVMITFEPQTVREPSIAEVLRIGYCVELNIRSGEGAQWHFLEVTVLCDTQQPEFRLVPLEKVADRREEAADTSAEDSSRTTRVNSRASKKDYITTCEFPCTFVFHSFTKYFQLENIGSDAIISLGTSSSCFKITSPLEEDIEIPGGSTVEIAVCFCPLSEAHYDAEQLFVTVRDERNGPVLAKHTFNLRGESALPHIDLLRIGPMELSPFEGDECSSVPQYFLPETTLGEEVVEEVVVRNNCPIAVEYFWQVATVGGGPSGAQLQITPCRGEFLPKQDTRFTVTLKPSVVEPFAAVLNLFLEGLPRIPIEGELGRTVDSCGPPLLPPQNDSRMAELDATKGVLRLLSRSRMVPALPEPEQLRRLMDPCGALKNIMKPQSSECSGVFASGFYLFADPSPPRLMLIPDRFDEGLECLINGENARRVVLRNTSHRLLHFIFDPTPQECPVGVCFPATYDPETVEVRFEPRAGRVPPQGSVPITFFYTLKEVGHHSMSVNCYIPELFELGVESSEGSPPLNLVTEVPCTHALHLSVTGVGPTLIASTHLLDFGLIEQGRESEASFTVTNDNPIPVSFELQDPKKCEPPRFVFLPQSFRLGVGESVEITVYRQAVDITEPQTFFELVVPNGGSIAIETRADIQLQTLVLRETVVNYGVVPNGSWTTQSFVVSNPFASDIPYTVQAVDVPPNIMVQVPPSGVVRAGCVDVQIPIRCAFSVVAAGGGKRAVVSFKNMRTTQEILVELCCEKISELTVAIDLIPVPKVSEGTCCMAYTPPILPLNLPEAPEMEISSYIESVLRNLIELEVLKCCVPRKSRKESFSAAVDDAVTNSVSALDAMASASGAGGTGELVLRPYCPPVHLRALLPHGEPVWSELVVLRITNLTGCHSTYGVNCTQYGFNQTLVDMRRSPTVGRATSKSMTMTASSIAATSKNRGRSRDGTTSRRRDSRRTFVGSPDSRHPFSAGYADGDDTKGRKAVVQPTFWCKNLDGSEQRERERRAALVGAQEALLDGRGCATIFGGPTAGALNPFAESKLPLTLSANLPGRYEETLKVHCGNMPPVHIPVSLELRGRPVLLDSTTAGLLVSDGKEILLMPSVLAGVGRSQRTLRLVNRLPRDVNVSFKIFLTNVTFSVFAVDDNVEANAVTLHLGPVTEEDHRRESEGKGEVAAAPEKFFLPAMGSQLVTIEYAPDANFVGANCSERKWLGGVIITAEYADTSFNDAFIIDEFYRIHPQYRPIDRVVKKSAREGDAAWTKSLLRPAAVLKVRQPVITRPGLIKKSTIIVPELGVASFSKRSGASRRRSLPICSDSFLGDHTAFSDDTTDSDEEGGEASAVIRQTETGRAQRHDVLRSSTSLEGERMELLSFIEKRRQEMMEHSRRYFVPIELELQALCGVAQLTVEPSENLVRFPTCVDGQRCTQTVLLTNRSCAVMAFMLDIPSPSFKLLKARLIFSDKDYKQLEVEDEETLICRKALESLKWCGVEERQKARRVVSLGQSKENTNKGCTQIVLEKYPTQNQRPTSRGSASTTGVVVNKYQLFPHDSLQVVLEYQSQSKAERDALACEGATVTGELNILYLPADVAIVKQQQSGAVEGKKPFHPPPVLELKQSIPLSLSFLNPSVTSSPSFLWFFPGQQIHDGRQQPSYVQKLRLMSLHPSPLSFKLSVGSTAANIGLVPARCNATPALGCLSGVAGEPRKAIRQLTLADETHNVFTRERKIREMKCYIKDDNPPAVGGVCVEGCAPQDGKGVTRELQPRSTPYDREKLLVIEDASRFTITPMEGIIPAATRGGQPGVFEILVEFKEHANMRFEAAFDVLIGTHHAKASSFFLRGDSRETEI
ncbi:uncharacterized protein TEOVI_000150500 [Trypanosoma equiperdum]|uniref:Abnormal spindle-like microcephaly-associated protein ASH domain-containing protein n=2 Tax=Trypanozoon TaxID=39700 RepID=Q57XV2_TRYB2|nr:hypothetical protein, conserved [Trypanosoma brucei brucei TREU927]AAX69566.1 hypothetical protein, conserved [Trypanosoma brucei]AAZ10154.1 hypothetical protein, conserved [Trypanosoma brucei brucei TREU927]SCU69936.1 hypothetical protein, conserved [Trypanosoma equiperdum]